MTSPPLSAETAYLLATTLSTDKNVEQCLAADFTHHRTYLTSCDPRDSASLWYVVPSFPTNDKTQVSVMTYNPSNAQTYALTMDPTCQNHTVSLTRYTGIPANQSQQFTLENSYGTIHSAACPLMCLSPPDKQSTNRHVRGNMCNDIARVNVWKFVPAQQKQTPAMWPRVLIGIIAGVLIAALLYGAIDKYAKRTTVVSPSLTTTTNSGG